MAILAAVDGEAVPDRAVSVGYDLARAYGDELIVVHVMPQERFEEIQESTVQNTKGTVLAPEADYDGPETTTVENENALTIDADGEPRAETVARDVVGGTLEEHSDVSFQGRVGDPAQEILEEAERQKARHIVVGGQKRSPVGKAVFGSVAQTVILNADRPVTTVTKTE